jgi:hypothetical protein
LPAKKRTGKKSASAEQLRLLKQILAELQTLNANLAAEKQKPQMAGADMLPSDESSDDELEEYE